MFDLDGSRRILLAGREDGLGTRLMNFLWAWRLARAVNVPLRLYWYPAPQTHREGLNYAFANFFAYDPAAHTDLEVIDPGVIDPDWPVRRIDGIRGAPPLSDATIFDGATVPQIGGYAPVRLASEGRADLKTEFPRIFSWLPLNAAVASACETVLPRLDGPVVGVHYRRGDIVRRIALEVVLRPAEERQHRRMDKWLGFYARKSGPAAAYFRLIDEDVPAETRLAVFSDDPTAVDLFRERYGARVLDLTVTSTLTPSQVALVHMLVLARTDWIVASVSAFSSAASLIGQKRVVNIGARGLAEDYFADVEAIIRSAGGSDDLVAQAIAVLRRNGFFLRLFPGAGD